MDITFIGVSSQTCKESPVHSHNCWEIMHITRGTGTITAQNQVRRLGPGEIAIVPPGIAHEIASDDEFTESSLFFRTFHPISNISFRILQDDSQQSTAKLLDMASIYHRPANEYERSVLNAVVDLLIHSLVVPHVTQQPVDSKLRQVLEDMHENIANPDFDLAASIAASGYCAGYFRRLFKESTEQSPVEYLQALRINHAKSLIHQYGSSRSLTEIAKNSGFHDPLYFSRVFKKVTGVSPRRYSQEQLLPDL